MARSAKNAPRPTFTEGRDDDTRRSGNICYQTTKIVVNDTNCYRTILFYDESPIDQAQTETEQPVVLDSILDNTISFKGYTTH